MRVARGVAQNRGNVQPKPQNVQPIVQPSIDLPNGGAVTPALLDALVDKNKRLKLEKINESLKSFHQSDNIRYGINGPTFTDINELLEATG